MTLATLYSGSHRSLKLISYLEVPRPQSGAGRQGVADSSVLAPRCRPANRCGCPGFPAVSLRLRRRSVRRQPTLRRDSMCQRFSRVASVNPDARSRNAFRSRKIWVSAMSGKSMWSGYVRKPTNVRQCFAPRIPDFHDDVHGDSVSGMNERHCLPCRGSLSSGISHSGRSIRPESKRGKG